MYILCRTYITLLLHFDYKDIAKIYDEKLSIL